METSGYCWLLRDVTGEPLLWLAISCDVMMTLLGSLFRVLTASGVKFFSEKFDEVFDFFKPLVPIHFPGGPQHCTFCISPLSDTPISGIELCVKCSGDPGVSVLEYISDAKFFVVFILWVSWEIRNKTWQEMVQTIGRDTGHLYILWPPRGWKKAPYILLRNVLSCNYFVVCVCTLLTRLYTSPFAREISIAGVGGH